MKASAIPYSSEWLAISLRWLFFVGWIAMWPPAMCLQGNLAYRRRCCLECRDDGPRGHECASAYHRAISALWISWWLAPYSGCKRVLVSRRCGRAIARPHLGNVF